MFGRPSRALSVPAAFLVSGALASGASAAPEDPKARIAPGVYELVASTGKCLHSDDGDQAMVSVGACDTRWRIEDNDKGYAVKHSVTGNCLAPSLAAVFPPHVATRSCEISDPVWTVLRTGADEVTVSLDEGFALLSWMRDYPLTVLVDEEPAGGGQRWTLRKS
ncbi:hypothetical protein [Actinocorallia aurantiaca]|uniref:Ricin-type beta-trefoil lectin protein n=1 Tax=Actinocorallia aurantiaca TaxID=46204 RepID=A0ABP6H5T5_9ACTN